MNTASFGAVVHTYAPHSPTALYAAAFTSALVAILGVYARCLWTKSVEFLPDRWIITTAAAAAPIPTYILLTVVPFDPDLARCVLDDRVVVALAGGYGLVETLKDIRGAAVNAHRRRRGEVDGSD